MFGKTYVGSPCKCIWKSVFGKVYLENCIQKYVFGKVYLPRVYLRKCIWESVFEKVYLGKLMSGHLLSLSRCLLNCKKENRGEYLLKILESQYAKIGKPKLIQNI